MWMGQTGRRRERLNGYVPTPSALRTARLIVSLVYLTFYLSCSRSLRQHTPRRACILRYPSLTHSAQAIVSPDRFCEKRRTHLQTIHMVVAHFRVYLFKHTEIHLSPFVIKPAYLYQISSKHTRSYCLTHRICFCRLSEIWNFTTSAP